MALELLSDQGFRMDGRRPNEVRRIRCKLNVFTQADGSAYFEIGNTKVLAAVYGPHEVKNRSKALHDTALVNCQFSTATFSTGERKRRPRGDRKSVEMTVHLKQTLESAILVHLYPRSQIDIYVEVLQSDGGSFCACLNAATVALIDAGIPMKDYVIACSAGYVEDTSIMDLNHVEENMGGQELVMATLPKSEQIVYLEMNSRLHEDQLEKIIDAGIKGCKHIHDIVNQAVKDHVNNHAVSAGWIE